MKNLDVGKIYCWIKFAEDLSCTSKDIAHFVQCWVCLKNTIVQCQTQSWHRVDWFPSISHSYICLIWPSEHNMISLFLTKLFFFLQTNLNPPNYQKKFCFCVFHWMVYDSRMATSVTLCHPRCLQRCGGARRRPTNEEPRPGEVGGFWPMGGLGGAQPFVWYDDCDIGDGGHHTLTSWQGIKQSARPAAGKVGEKYKYEIILNIFHTSDTCFFPFLRHLQGLFNKNW